MARLGIGWLLVLLRFGTILGGQEEEGSGQIIEVEWGPREEGMANHFDFIHFSSLPACQNTSAVFSSRYSCSSYFFCDQLGRIKEKECEEGMLWKEEEQYCDWEQNVSCGRGKLEQTLQFVIFTWQVFGGTLRLG